MNKTLSAHIASVLLIFHGLIEITGLMLIKTISHTLISFGGLTGSALEQNSSTVAIFGVLWGLARFTAAGGTWSLRKWAVLLGIILSVITILAAITIIPAGVIDTLFAIPTLIFLLYTWFGSQKFEL